MFHFLVLIMFKLVPKLQVCSQLVPLDRNPRPPNCATPAAPPGPSLLGSGYWLLWRSVRLWDPEVNIDQVQTGPGQRGMNAHRPTLGGVGLVMEETSLRPALQHKARAQTPGRDRGKAECRDGTGDGA